MRRTRKVVCGISLAIIILCMVFAWALYVRPKKDPSFTVWYVMPESEYVRFVDRKKDAAARWLQSEPSTSSHMELLERSRYTYDEWLARGRKIKHLETSLIEIYGDPNCGISRNYVLHALFKIGTVQSVPVLIESFREDNLSNDQKYWIAVIIGKYGDASAVEPLVNFIEEIQPAEDSPDSERILKLNLIGALISYAPEKAGEYLLGMREDSNMHEHQHHITHMLEEIEKVKTAN